MITVTLRPVATAGGGEQKKKTSAREKKSNINWRRTKGWSEAGPRQKGGCLNKRGGRKKVECLSMDGKERGKNRCTYSKEDQTGPPQELERGKRKKTPRWRREKEFIFGKKEEVGPQSQGEMPMPVSHQ